MNLKEMTDEELERIRGEIEAWCDKYTRSIWSGGKGFTVALFGVFGIATGIVFIFMDGFEPTSLIPILLGTVISFMWFKAERQYKKNSGFLESVRNEIARRKRKVESKSAKKTDSKLMTEV